MADKTDLLVIGEITDQMQVRLETRFHLHDYFGAADKEALIAHKGASIEAIATNGHDGVPDNLIDRLENLKVISCYGVGYDAINVRAAADRGILVSHTPDVLNEEVTVTAMMLLMGVSRQLRFNMEWISSGDWEHKGNAPLSRSLTGLKVGLVGYGRIGRTIAEKLDLFGCEVSYHARNERAGSQHRYFANLRDMAQACDALIVITPGGPGTQKLINAEILAALGAEGFLVNVARGSVVDEAALIHALENGIIAGAGLDVFEKEPHVPAPLHQHPHVICTPHIGSATVETRAAMGNLTVDNLLQYFSDRRVLTPVPELTHLNPAG
jgi:lactate dehydrogenase-like 2-hydroxyacid dehydrogenase